MKLPPLNALKAFEAAARTGSFVDAGKALGVSSAAVSQQVRSLEEYWGRRLFIRQGNRIALTEAGRSTYPRLSAAFETIAELSDTLSDVPSRRRLVLSVPASLAVTWLPRKLRHLGENGPALEVRIEEDPVSFGLDGADLRVFYGHGLYGEYQVETLYQDHIIAVASPEFARQHLGQGLATLDARHLIHTEWGANYATSPNWTDWLAKYAERRHLPLGSGILADQSSLSQSLARAGLGVALLPGAIAAGGLESGDLVQVGEACEPMQYPYLLALPRAIAGRVTVRNLVRVLKGGEPR